MNDLLDKPALELNALLKKGEISSHELTKGYLERIEKKNLELSAFTQILKRPALKHSLACDKALTQARKNNTIDELPFFTGLPTAIKDLTMLKGSFTRMGSRTYRYLISPIDGWIAKRIKASGFVILGKLATAEFGAMPITEPDIHPPTRNPYNQNHSAGGSSGGTGAAVGAHLIPFGQGGDGAGSIRIPSSFCNCYGFKPSRDLDLCTNIKVDKNELSAAGPMAHTVRDAAALLDSLYGITHYTDKNKASSFLYACEKEVPKLKIKLSLKSLITPVDPVIEKAVRKVAAKLEEMGHSVEEAPVLNIGLDDFLPLWQKQLANVPVPFDHYVQPVTKWLRQHGKSISDESNSKRFKQLEQGVLDWFGDADLVLSPSVAVFPPQIGAWRLMPPAEAFANAANLGAFTAPFNVTGQPAASIPAGFGPNNLPFGIQIAGKRGEDATILALSRVLEEIMPWQN